ncbi:DUF2254 domain-containing protein [Marinobacterium rhizophilum]|uniref:DUF2254 domain-containing protein n=1 Tax=Marinobacterium rhizophilum TaxID=420402 RepID=A0ABY5HI24_9GAMM|nr:DUF2254 domain-containing protein [Marinobacterium rhizophilum]UTW11888.1 DUF2254 domain-containing protein [Marinobacterium rhizophilum]
MHDRLRFILNRISERLWVKPLLICMLSILLVFVAKLADYTDLTGLVPDISPTSIDTLLSIIASSMLVIATFAVASMVSAYASASNTATPRTFSLVISDDESQNALSAFIGAFIFSIVALVALQNGYYGRAGYFALFVLTLLVFAIVVVTFVRWVDSIARLGRLGSTVRKAEQAAARALARRHCAPTLRGIALAPLAPDAQPVYSDSIGYVQIVDLAALQALAAASQLRISLCCLPGSFVGPGRALAQVSQDPAAQTGCTTENDAKPWSTSEIACAFRVQPDRTFDEDPRFGLIVLAEIAGRALSPAVNDPGTAIDVIGSLVRLFALWARPVSDEERGATLYDRVAVPELGLRDLFDDAFTPIARDGAANLEVALRLQKAFASLAASGHTEMQQLSLEHAQLALARAEQALAFPPDRAALHQVTAHLTRSSSVRQA